MTDAAISLSFPARQGYAIFLRTAVSGAAAAYDLPLDALEDLREAALEAFSALTESADEGAQALCDIYRAQADQVTLSLRLGGRAGVPVRRIAPISPGPCCCRWSIRRRCFMMRAAARACA